MNNFILIAATIIASLITTSGFGQYNFDFGVKLGGSNYLGDIGGDDLEGRGFIMDMKIQETNLVAGVYARKKINGTFGLQGSIDFGKVSGDDALSTNPGRMYRNLRFKNNILQFSAKGEIYIFELNDVGNKGRYWVDMKTYAFAGISGFRHNPKGQIYGTADWHELQPLQTEGVEYSRWGFGIPAGVGVYFTYKRKHRFGWDLTWTTTFTDYIDDISSVYVPEADLSSSLAVSLANQTALITDDAGILANYAAPNENNAGKRGDPTKNDSFLFTTFSYGYVIRGKSNFYTQNYGWLSGRKKTVRKVRAKF